MATFFWVGGAGTWDNSSTGNWSTSSGGSSGAGPPTSSDTAKIDGNSGSTFNITIAASTTVTCEVLDWTGTNGNFVGFQAGSGAIQVGNGTTGQIKGNGLIGSNVSWTINGSVTITGGDNYGSSSWAFSGSGDTFIIGDLANYGLIFPDIPSGCEINVNGNQLNLSNATTLEGTIVLNGGTIYFSSPFSIDNRSGTLTVDTGTVEFSNGFSNPGNFGVPGTFSAASGTVVLAGGTGAFGGATIGTFIVGGTCTITGNNSYGTFSCPAAAGYAENLFQPLGNVTITLGASSTQTITTASGLSLLGNVSNVITINSSSPGTQANFSMASGTCTGAYLSLKDNNATGGATFNPGTGSVLLSDVTGWTVAAATTPLPVQTLIVM